MTLTHSNTFIEVFHYFLVHVLDHVIMARKQTLTSPLNGRLLRDSQIGLPKTTLSKLRLAISTTEPTAKAITYSTAKHPRSSISSCSLGLK